jgi:hypothetical protein
VRATEEDNTYEGDGSNIGGWDRYLARERKISVMYAQRYAQLFCAIVLVGCIELEEETSCTVMATLFIGGEWFHGGPLASIK